MPKAAFTETKRKELLEAYLSDRSAHADLVPVTERRPAGSVLPLTFTQRQLWLHAQMSPDTALYNEPLTVRYKGPLDVPALERAFTEIVIRHEAWRTTFPAVEGHPVQLVQEPFKVVLPVADLRGLPWEERDQQATRLATEMAREPFHLARLPLFRTQLLRITDEDYRLCVCLHHLIFDGFSGYQVFLPELSSLYKAFSSGQASPLEPLPYQLGDYALWQQKSMEGHELEQRLEFWKHQLAGSLPVLQLPVAHARSASPGFGGAVHSLQLPRSLSVSLRKIGQQGRATLFMVILAAFNVLLHRYSGEEDILIGSNTAGRKRPGSEKLLGYFLNTVVLRSDLSGNPGFLQLLERVRKTTLDVLAHDDVPLDRLMAELQPNRGSGCNPLFQVLLSLEPPIEFADPAWDITCIDVETGTAKYDLCLVLDDRSDGLLCRFIYSTELFDRSTITRLSQHWQALLGSIVRDPGQRIGDLNLLTEAERNQVLFEWNSPQQLHARVPVHKQIELQAAKTPNTVAAICGDRRLTYCQLNEQAEVLAEMLQRMGAGPDVPIALCVEQSLEMIVGILGILKAGAAYLPLDPTHPQERLDFMLADSKTPLLLTQSSLKTGRLGRDIQTICLDLPAQRKLNSAGAASVVAPTLDNLAYIIYTSGSSGAPKGVLITHGNLAHSNQARLQYYREPVGRFLLLSSYAFDSSVAGIFHSLTSGGTLVIPPAKFRWQPQQVSGLIAEHQISHILCLPSLYREVLEQSPASQLSSLRAVIVAGEACPRSLLKCHYRSMPNVPLFNEYGPTEATVWCSVYECEPSESEASVPIGRAIPGTRLYVLDRNLQPLPVGVPGELCVGGDGVAKGYHNRPDLTRASFVRDAFGPAKSSRLYRTGDLVRHLPSGYLEFLGRIDQQVKIRGMRIELAEVESILGQHPDVREAAVVMETQPSGNPHLVAHVITREDYSTSSNELRAFLKSRLPAYMIPSAFHFRSAFPRTSTGKVDRQGLLGTVYPVNENRTQIPAATNDLEKRLLAIWQRVLKSESQDITQDFFEAGGHSLLAAKLLLGIEKEFNRTLSLAFVFQFPTIAQMAESLGTAGQTLRDRAIVPIQPVGSRPALFWVRGGPRFRLLAKKLGPDQPFLGLDLPHVDAAKLAVPYRLEDIGSLLVKAMQEEQPHGPYNLAGLCVNAVLAYEIARQLLQKGEEVGLLALFDGHNQAYYKDPFRDGRYSGRIKYHLSNLLQLDAREAPNYLLARLDEARRKIERITWELTAGLGSGDERSRNSDNIVHPAFHRYEPQPYSGKMILLQSSDWPAGSYFDFKLGWMDLVQGGIDFYRIPGDHPSMFTEPNVNLVAEQLRRCLAESDLAQG